MMALLLSGFDSPREIRSPKPNMLPPAGFFYLVELKRFVREPRTINLKGIRQEACPLCPRSCRERHGVARPLRANISPSPRNRIIRLDAPPGFVFWRGEGLL
jgi:hypothetical protein